MSNIITKKPKTEVLKGNISHRLRRFTQQDINLDIKQRIKKFRFAFFANRYSSEGYDLNQDADGQSVNPFVNYTLNRRVFYDFSDKLSLFSSVRFYDQTQESGFTFDDTFFEGNTKEQDWNAHLKLDQKWNDCFKVKYELYYTNYTAAELISNAMPGEVLNDSDFDQKLLRPEISGNYTFEKAGTITAGIGNQYDGLERTFFDERINFNSKYVYAQYDVNPSEKLNAIVGFRFDKHSEYSYQFSKKLHCAPN